MMKESERIIYQGSTNKMNHPQQDNEWIDCPKGKIVEVARFTKSRERQQTVRKVSLGVSTLCVLLFAGYLVVGQPFSGKLLAGIYCKDVLKHADAYLSGEIDEDLAKTIQMHLTLCETCKIRINQMKNRNMDERSQMNSELQTAVLSTTQLSTTQ